jgi:hypothetical protein
MGTTFPGSVYNCEAAVLTLSLLWIPLGLLHLLCWLYQTQARQQGQPHPHFPHTIAKLPVVPQQFPWMRVATFVGLLVWPTFVHCYTAGRLFDHYGIIDRNHLPAPFATVTADNKPIPASQHLDPVYPKAITGPRLLTTTPETTTGKPYSTGSSGWVWINTHRQDELRPRVGDPKDTNRLVTIQAFPIVQPWGFLLSSILLGLTCLLLTIRGFLGRTKPQPLPEPTPDTPSTEANYEP